MGSYAVLTLGCKLNQADSAAVAGRLNCGFKAVAPEEADIVIINTCTVTQKADREAKRLIRSVRRQNPSALVAVMGCGTRLRLSDFGAMAEVDAVLPSGKSVEEFLAQHAPESRDRDCVPCFRDRTRAFLKVQEGCDFPCTYCIIPTVRGPSRSVPLDEVVLQFQHLLDLGYKEVVLTGVNTGEYGKDISCSGGLPHLLEELFSIQGRYRIRLNSIEPRTVTEALVDLFKGERRLCRHLQIPLQSGSDRVLGAMRRNYHARFYEDVLTRLSEEIPGIGLGADVLVGFPTETARDFEDTLDLLARSPIAFIHAFPYSSRPGTPAAMMPGLPSQAVAGRAAQVRRLAKEKKRAFEQAMVAAEIEALTLASQGESGRALTGNYIDIPLDKTFPPNRWVRLQVGLSSGGALKGQVLHEG